jgi:hypothetical protein
MQHSITVSLHAMQLASKGNFVSLRGVEEGWTLEAARAQNCRRHELGISRPRRPPCIWNFLANPHLINVQLTLEREAGNCLW